MKTIKDLISDGTYALYSNYQMYLYFKYVVEHYPTDEYLRLYEKYSCYSNNMEVLQQMRIPDYYLDLIKKYYSRRSSKVSRLKKRIKKMFVKDCVFLTLTFRDNVLSSCSSDTRRTYVRRFLKEFGVPYVANIDFGLDDNFTHREHYHAILQKDKIPLNCWSYGVSHVEKIRCDLCSSAKLSQYIVKITNHAYKDSTKNLTNLIYSRRL